MPSGGLLHVEGPQHAPNLLLLHGVGGGAWSWGPQRAAFSPAYRTFTWEARGHGEATPVADAGLSDYYTDATEALEAVAAQTGEPAVVAGHSMGGLLAIALACDRKPMVRALYLVDPVYSDGNSDSYGHMPPNLGRVALWMCEPLLRSFARGDAFSERLAHWFFAQSFEDRERMEAAWAYQRRQVPIEYDRMLRESFTNPTGFALRDFAAEIDAPTCVVECYRAGGRPRFPSFVAKLRERLGDRFVEDAVRGGHYLQLDRPEEVNASLGRFLELFAPTEAARAL